MEQIATTFDWALAYHCAPALAGIKPADLFSWPLTAMEEMREYQSALAACGVQLRVLRQGRRQLLLVYRAKCLERCLACAAVRQMLLSAGYPPEGTVEELLSHLMTRLQGESFPHEIGLFLGYPPADVEGFCKNKGQNYKLCGRWKVYADAEAAQQYFDRCDRCRAAICRHVHGGKRITELFRAS